MAHVPRWSKIIEGKMLPPPVSITIDPTNACNLKCKWCNADYRLKHNNGKLSKSTMLDIADFISGWGVETVCVAGGGEPLLNPDVGEFILKCKLLGVQTGVVTNGIKINEHIHALSRCTWVGVSIDSGTEKIYEELKGKNYFSDVINNIKSLINYSEKNNRFLTAPGQGHGVSYKYLLHPKNICDVYTAAKIAKDIGCRNMHIRPFGEAWDKVGLANDIFSYSDIQEFREQLTKAYTLENDKFHVFGITHKFDGDLRKKNDFKKCYAVFMQGVFMPPSANGNFDYGLCCDRRGDPNMTLENLHEAKEIKSYWGSDAHWLAFKNIIVNECPRCTYQPHNIIFEKTILENNMTYGFI